LRELDKRIKGADDWQPKICQNKFFGGLMMPYS